MSLPASAVSRRLGPATARLRAGVALLLAAGLLDGGARAHAAPADLAALDLDQLMQVEIVSAARKAQPLGEVPAAVFVITRDDIRRSGARSLPEALRLAPGMDVAQTSSATWSVTTRGFPGRFANKLQVLIDGRSVYWEMFSGVLWEAERVPMADIERIEVIRGPAGAVWGANAVNGVINIITRAAADTPGTRVQARTGTGDQVGLAVQHGWHVASPDGSGPHLRLQAQADGAGALRTAQGESANDRLRVGSAGLRADWGLPDGARLTLHGGLLHSSGGNLLRMPLAAPPYAMLLPSHQAVEQAVAGAVYERALGPGLSLALQGSVLGMRGELASLGRYAGRALEADARWRWQGTPAHDVVFGLSGRVKHSEFDTDPASLLLHFDPGTRRLLEWGAYAQDEIRLAERWRLTLGARLDHHSLSGTHVQPSARLQWHVSERASAWAALSRAVRVPSRLEADARMGLGMLAPGMEGNPTALPLLVALHGRGLGHLQSESVEALEAGWRAQLAPSLSLDLAAFVNRYREVPLSGGLGGLPALIDGTQPVLLGSLANLPGTLHSRGLELAVDWRVRPGWRQQFSVSPLHFDAASRARSPAAQGSPRLVALTRSSFDLPGRTTLDLLLRHTGARGAAADAAGSYTPALTELDAQLVWQATAALELSAGGRNLLHRARMQIQHDFGVAESARIQRSFGIGLKARF